MRLIIFLCALLAASGAYALGLGLNLNLENQVSTTALTGITNPSTGQVITNPNTGQAIQ